MASNGGSPVGLLSYETLVHAVAGAMVRDHNETLHLETPAVSLTRHKTSFTRSFLHSKPDRVSIADKNNK